MHFPMFDHHVTLPPPPRVCRHRQSEGASLVTSLLSLRLWATAPQQSTRDSGSETLANVETGKVAANLETTATPPLQICSRGECRRRPSFDETDFTVMHSPRPHERPSGYR